MEAAEIVGNRFHPTDKHLVGHHLKNRLLGIEETKCLIPVLNIYDHQPWDLHRIYNEKADKKSCGKECFFFCPRNGSGRTNRKAGGGFWKDTSQIRTIKAGKTVGTKRILVFYEGKQKKGSRKTEWVMHEYHLNALNEGAAVDDLGAFALCCFKRKPMNKKEKARASACQANLSSPSTDIVEVEEPTNQEVSGQLVIENAVSDTTGFNVEEFLQNIGDDEDEETSPAILHDSIPLIQHQMEEMLPTDAATASSGVLQDIDNSFMWLYEFAATDDFSELLCSQ